MYKNTNEDEESVKSASTLDTDKTEKAGTLVTKYFFSVLMQQWNGRRSRVLHRMFIMSPCIFQDKAIYVQAPI